MKKGQNKHQHTAGRQKHQCLSSPELRWSAHQSLRHLQLCSLDPLEGRTDGQADGQRTWHIKHLPISTHPNAYSHQRNNRGRGLPTQTHISSLSQVIMKSHPDEHDDTILLIPKCRRNIQICMQLIKIHLFNCFNPFCFFKYLIE